MAESRMNLASQAPAGAATLDGGSKKAADREPAAFSGQQRNRHRAPRRRIQLAHHQKRQADFDQVKHQPASQHMRRLMPASEKNNLEES